MKNILSGLFIAGALLLASCSGVLDDVTQPEGNGTTGTVLVQIGSPAEARTLAPETSDITAYIVRYANGSQPANGDSWESVTVDSTTHITPFSLEPGSWTFEAIGYADSNKTEAVAEGATMVTVEQGKVATAAILLNKAGDTNVKGYFHYDVEWTAIVDVTTDLKLTLTPREDISGFPNTGSVERDLLHGNFTSESETEEKITSTGTTVSGTIQLPSGVYDMDIALTVGPGVVTYDMEPTIVHRTEVVYIYSHLTTKAPKYTFTDLDVQKLRLTGPRPTCVFYRNDRSWNGSYYIYYTTTISDIVADSMRLYDTTNAEIIPFYTSINGEVPLTSVPLTSSGWTIYVPAGYAGTMIKMEAIYSYQGESYTNIKFLSIKSNQNSEYTLGELESSHTYSSY
jgi:hypothetical protein